ncbi:probable serine/threonine-protein kinase nek3 [Condylostylus longicornis]|uniref:probable serine/threonine-protein kinase nek3 n=1 Tax=Condylostylus longicornis TaxID=2530218 RepID=UPI00244E2259|nr:probable serine/threonine-protein kinase nek3 [Condylostylus longicornis]
MESNKYDKEKSTIKCTKETVITTSSSSLSSTSSSAVIYSLQPSIPSLSLPNIVTTSSESSSIKTTDSENNQIKSIQMPIYSGIRNSENEKEENVIEIKEKRDLIIESSNNNNKKIKDDNSIGANNSNSNKYYSDCASENIKNANQTTVITSTPFLLPSSVSSSSITSITSPASQITQLPYSSSILTSIYNTPTTSKYYRNQAIGSSINPDEISTSTSSVLPLSNFRSALSLQNLNYFTTPLEISKPITTPSSSCTSKSSPISYLRTSTSSAISSASIYPSSSSLTSTNNTNIIEIPTTKKKNHSNKNDYNKENGKTTKHQLKENDNKDSGGTDDGGVTSSSSISISGNNGNINNNKDDNNKIENRNGKDNLNKFYSSEKKLSTKENIEKQNLKAPTVCCCSLTQKSHGEQSHHYYQHHLQSNIEELKKQQQFLQHSNYYSREYYKDIKKDINKKGNTETDLSEHEHEKIVSKDSNRRENSDKNECNKNQKKLSEDEEKDELFQIFQPWALKTYGDQAKTKTITLKKKSRILKALDGKEHSKPDSSKFRFWVKSKGFTTHKPEGFVDTQEQCKQSKRIGTTDNIDLYVASTSKDFGERYYRKVAVVEEFFDIIYNVHVNLGGRSGRHAGQKRTYRIITETYAFLPREAVTKFLTTCPECKKNLRPYSPNTKVEEHTTNEISVESTEALNYSSHTESSKDSANLESKKPKPEESEDVEMTHIKSHTSHVKTKSPILQLTEPNICRTPSIELTSSLIEEQLKIRKKPPQLWQPHHQESSPNINRANIFPPPSLPNFQPSDISNFLNSMQRMSNPENLLNLNPLPFSPTSVLYSARPSPPHYTTIDRESKSQNSPHQPCPPAADTWSSPPQSSQQDRNSTKTKISPTSYSKQININIENAINLSTDSIDLTITPPNHHHLGQSGSNAKDNNNLMVNSLDVSINVSNDSNQLKISCKTTPPSTSPATPSPPSTKTNITTTPTSHFHEEKRFRDEKRTIYKPESVDISPPFVSSTSTIAPTSSGSQQSYGSDSIFYSTSIMSPSIIADLTTISNKNLKISAVPSNEETIIPQTTTSSSHATHSSPVLVTSDRQTCAINLNCKIKNIDKSKAHKANSKYEKEFPLYDFHSCRNENEDVLMMMKTIRNTNNNNKERTSSTSVEAATTLSSSSSTLQELSNIKQEYSQQHYGFDCKDVGVLDSGDNNSSSNSSSTNSTIIQMPVQTPPITTTVSMSPKYKQRILPTTSLPTASISHSYKSGGMMATGNDDVSNFCLFEKGNDKKDNVNNDKDNNHEHDNDNNETGDKNMHQIDLMKVKPITSTYLTLTRSMGLSDEDALKFDDLVSKDFKYTI